jgi:LPS sulfotransferase NodH
MTWKGHHGFKSHGDYFRRFVEQSTTANGIFGTKLFWGQYAAWTSDINRSLDEEYGRLEAVRKLVGPIRVVHLTREDRLRQAISFVRARQSGIWSRQQGDAQSEATVSYDRRLIHETIEQLEWQDEQWRHEFAGVGIPVLGITYEQLATDLTRVVRRVLALLGVPPMPHTWEASSSLLRLSDDTTEEWVRRMQTAT